MIFSFTITSSSMIRAPTGQGILESMVFKRDRINLEVLPSTSPGTAQNSADCADDAILILARLIGRQIAREQFKQRVALERRGRKKR